MKNGMGGDRSEAKRKEEDRIVYAGTSNTGGELCEEKESGTDNDRQTGGVEAGGRAGGKKYGVRGWRHDAIEWLN